MKKFIAIILLALSLTLSGQSSARTKFYKSNSDMPFVQMMLNMMVVMGILDKIPPYLLNGYGASPYANPYSRWSTFSGYPLSGLGSRGLDNRYRYPYYAGRGYSPLNRNPLLGFPSASPFNKSYYRGYGYRDELEQSPWLPMEPSTCYGGTCDVRETGLNGLWLGDDGEMLGIKDDQFLWTDGHDQHITGLMVVTPERVVANVDGTDQQISFEYIVKGDQLVTRDKGGDIHNFWRADSVPNSY